MKPTIKRGDVTASPWLCGVAITAPTHGHHILSMIEAEQIVAALSEALRQVKQISEGESVG